MWFILFPPKMKKALHPGSISEAKSTDGPPPAIRLSKDGTPLAGCPIPLLFLEGRFACRSGRFPDLQASFRNSPPSRFTSSSGFPESIRPFTVAGPRRSHTGFPFNSQASIARKHPNRYSIIRPPSAPA